MANEVHNFNIGGVDHEVQDLVARQAVAAVQTALDALTSGDTTTAIKTFQEVIDFLDGVTDSETLIGKLNVLNTAINGKYTKPNGGIPASDLEGSIPAGKLSQDVQTSLGKADTAYQKPQTGIPATDLEEGVIPDTSNLATKTELAGKVDKETGKGLSSNDYTTADKNKLAGIAAGAEVNVNADWNAVSGDAQILNKPTLANVATSGSYNDLSNKPTIPDTTGMLTQSDVSVETQGDGTVDINVGSDSYSINLNHTHENMAKVVKVASEPATMDNDTIYVKVDNLQNPTEIESLYLFGLEFSGGGGGTGPRLRKPADGSAINVGVIEPGESDVTKTIDVKGYELTQALTVAVTGTGFSVNKQSISAADAMAGTTLAITYDGTGNGVGELTISSSEVRCECDLSADAYTSLLGVKLTGTQWLQTDYHPNANTEFELDLKFDTNSKSNNSSAITQNIIGCPPNTSDGKRFVIFNGTAAAGRDAAADMFVVNESSITSPAGGNQVIALATGGSFSADFLSAHSKITYAIGSPYGRLSFIPGNGGTTKGVDTSLKTSTMDSPMTIGYKHTSPEGIYDVLNITIFEFTVTEGGTTVRHWVPCSLNNVPGLYDTINKTFISSETATELVAVTQ